MLQYVRISLRENAFFRVTRLYNPAHLLLSPSHYTMPRTPLSSISSNRVRNTQYTPYQKKLIIKAVAAGYSPSRIRNECEVPKNSTRYILLISFSHNHNTSTKHTNRPKSLSIRNKRHILRIVRRTPKITYKNFIEKAKLNCSHNTIYRLLKKKNITNWLTKKRSLLTSKHTALRYEWALQHQNWN